MKAINSIGLLILISAVVFSCTTSKTLYDRGQYYESVMRSVEKLRKSPNNKNARTTLVDAYPQAVNAFMDQLESQDQANAEFKFSNAVYTYQKLNKMYESIQRSPAAMEVIPNPNKYYSTLERIKPDAAQEQYNAGMRELSYNNRENAKNAYRFFLEADRFLPGYRDVSQRIEEAYQRSILIVIADIKPVQSRTYELSAEVFYQQVNNTLKQIENNEFIRFYSPEQAEKNNLNQVHQVLEINFEDSVVGETHTKETIEKMSRDSVIVGEVTLDGGRKKEVIGTVEADISILRMEIVSRGLVNLTISQEDNLNKPLTTQDFPGQFVWYHEWGSFNGDKRALTDHQVEICASQRINPPPPQQMFVEFTKPIQQQLHSRLVSFYRNY